jgi:hypothetical protein
MEFFIKQNSVLPILKMDVVSNGRDDSYLNFNLLLINSVVKFNMVDAETGVSRIISKAGGIVKKNKISENSHSEYYVFYRWSENDTKKKGRFVGEFIIESQEGELICPILNTLFINII